MRIDASGNVGIGTISPVSRLHIGVTGASNGTIDSRTGLHIQSTNITTGTANARIQFSHASNTPKAYIEAGVFGSDYLAFGNGSGTAEAMRINAGGDVGIGTSSPAQKLDVNGNIKVGVNQWIGNTSGASYIADDGVVGGAMINGGGFRIYTGGSNERMRIDSSGNVLVGTTSSTQS
jgi:hypothetical protein